MMQNRLSFVKAAMIQGGCETPEDLRNLTCKQRKKLAGDLIRFRSSLLQSVTLEECNELLALIENADPEPSLEAAFDKLVSVLLDLDCAHCGEKHSMELCNANADLFADLTAQLGCEFMSNMKYEPYRTMAALHIANMTSPELHYYPLRQYEDFAESKYLKKVHFSDYSEVTSFFRELCSEAK